MKKAFFFLACAGSLLLARGGVSQDSNGVSLTMPHSQTRRQTLSSTQTVVRQPSLSKNGTKNTGTIHPKNRPFSLAASPGPTPGKIRSLTPLPTVSPRSKKMEILDKNGKPVTAWSAGTTIHYPTLYRDTTH